jgi:NDP-sugar pyrophosphorylase family protein
VEAVVLAAGEGRRMRPLTDRWPKALLPIDGRPVLATLLRELSAAGLSRATVVVGHLGEQVDRFLAAGCGFGLEVELARQLRPFGSADALEAALRSGARAPLLVTAADTVFRQGDLAAVAARFAASGAAGALGVRAVPSEVAGERASVRIESGRVVRVLERPAPGAVEGSVATGAPLWLLREPMLVHMEALPGPPFQLADVFQRAIDAGEEVAALELGPTRDLTRPADVVLHNFPYLWT